MRNVNTRAREISEFLGVEESEVLERLNLGFHHNHALVAQDFKSKSVDVNNDESLLEWYRDTDAYIYELTAYHLDELFNYSGMCEGIGNTCIANNWQNVLCLGDGIGDLSIHLDNIGLTPTYHDLEGGLNERYFSQVAPNISKLLTVGWDPDIGFEKFHAVVALDFFEHLVNVEEWAVSTYQCLVEGGGFLAQNAFAIGDAEHGDSIPMHLSINNKYEREWVQLMEKVGFRENRGGWWIK